MQATVTNDPVLTISFIMYVRYAHVNTGKGCKGSKYTLLAPTVQLSCWLHCGQPPYIVPWSNFVSYEDVVFKRIQKQGF